MSKEDPGHTGHRPQVTGHRQQALKKGAEGTGLMKGADICIRLVRFAAACLKIAERLPKHAAGRHVGMQLVRSGTGGGSNYEEARAAESAADFAHKTLIAAKEVREAVYWLSVLQNAGWLAAEIATLVSEAGHLAAILAASARTARRRIPPP